MVIVAIPIIANTVKKKIQSTRVLSTNVLSEEYGHSI
jgi:hypothetical protein